MLYLTAEQHQEAVARLLNLARKNSTKISYRRADFQYASLMFCFLLQNLSCAEALLRMARSFGNEWLPVSIGYMISRTMFETDVTGHYITQEPIERSRQYIEFSAVLENRQMDACHTHMKSKDSQWRESMTLLWQNHWGPREADVSNRYNAVLPRFTREKGKVFANWSGKTLRQMSAEVDHLEAYDVFYSELSSFTHGDVHLADRYLQICSESPVWSQRAKLEDVGNVFRYAGVFLTCYLELFARQFKVWSESDVQNCWTHL